MHTTPRIRRLSAAALAASVVTILSGCVLAPPAQQTPPPSTSPQAPQPSTSAPSAGPSEPAQSDAPTTGPYELQNDPEASVVWSFEPVDAQRVETDALGAAADPGQQLVVLHVSGEVLRGEPDFYYQFTVAIVNPSTGESLGLSSGSSFYAEDDLFTVGRQASFVDADAIYQVPDSWPIDTWRFTCNETGEVWDVTVPTS